jgi:hypothetical protein
VGFPLQYCYFPAIITLLLEEAAMDRKKVKYQNFTEKTCNKKLDSFVT